LLFFVATLSSVIGTRRGGFEIARKKFQALTLCTVGFPTDSSLTMR
jgi:hypothetical protein